MKVNVWSGWWRSQARLSQPGKQLRSAWRGQPAASQPNLPRLHQFHPRDLQGPGWELRHLAHAKLKLKFLNLEPKWTRSPSDQQLSFSRKANTYQHILIWKNIVFQIFHQCQSHFCSLSNSAPTSAFSLPHNPSNTHPWLCPSSFCSPGPLFLRPRKSSIAPTVSPTVASTWRYAGHRAEKGDRSSIKVPFFFFFLYPFFQHDIQQKGEEGDGRGPIDVASRLAQARTKQSFSEMLGTFCPIPPQTGWVAEGGMRKKQQSGSVRTQRAGS